MESRGYLCNLGSASVLGLSYALEPQERGFFSISAPTPHDCQTLPYLCGFGWPEFLVLSPNTADLCLSLQPKTISCVSLRVEDFHFYSSSPQSNRSLPVFKKGKKLFTPSPEANEFCFNSSPEARICPFPGS